MCCKFLSRNHRIVCSDKSARSSYESGEIICRLVVEQRGLHHTDALKDALPSIPPLKRIAEKGPRMMELVMIMMELVIYLLGKSGATKSDEFWEKFQISLGPLPLCFGYRHWTFSTNFKLCFSSDCFIFGITG